MNADRPERLDHRRDELIDAAFRAFMTTGYVKTSMSDIAAEAGVSRPTLYRSFANKSDLFLAAAERLHEQTSAACAEAAARPGDLDERLAAAAIAQLSAHVEIVLSSPHGTALLDVNRRIGGELAAAAVRRFEALVRSLLTAAAVDGEIDARFGGATAAQATRLVVAVVDGWKLSLTQAAPPRTWRADVEVAMRIVVRGLAQPPDA